ncbi:hypothetical protein KW797_00455 [Candidatus Parcubacteria bacterium]|nr:hypothetical protein [Candidatus Parcubacteria bacterium]
MGAPNPYFRITAEKFAGHGRKFAKGASTVYRIGGIVSFNVTVGTIRPMTAGDPMLGLVMQPVATTDSNYADTTPIEIEILFHGAEVFCPVSSGTPALTEIGDELDVVTGGLSVTTTESNKDFTSIALNGASTTDIYAAVRYTSVY